MVSVEIPRQVQTHRANPDGMLRGSAPTRHQVRELDLRIESLPGGRLRVSTPLARGWAAVAGNPHELARAIASAFIEVQVASYARWKGESFDLDELTDVDQGDSLAAAVRTTEFKHRKRNDIHNPADWTPLEGGFWRAPNGRRYRPDTRITRSVVAARIRLGIPVRPGDLDL